MNAENIYSRLITEFGYTEKKAKRIVTQIQESSPTIQEAFERWWLGDGLDEHLEFHGYTLQKLTEIYKFKPIGAFLTLDWLEKEPALAAKVLAQGRVIFKPSIPDEYK